MFFKKDLLKRMDFNTTNLFHMLVNYQLDSKIIKQDFPFKYSILEHKKKLTQFLNDIVTYKLMNFNKLVTNKNGCCTKIVYHIAYNTFILLNNSTNITNEQKQIIQKIHDGEMSIEYLSELEILINTLE